MGTKWDRVSIQCKQHRIVGALLCDYDQTVDDEQRKKEKMEIRDAVYKIKKLRLNDLNTCNALNWCKNMSLTLQNYFGGQWCVMIGHRAQYRSFHSVILDDDSKYGNDMYGYDQQAQMTQKVEFKINNKTNAEYIQFGIGPSWMNWSVIVAQVSTTF